jgi:hypothetical protein
MARSRITSPSKDLITDDGAILASLAEGEQIRIEITINWLINLSDYFVVAKVVEALNEGKVVSVDDDNLPDRVRPDGDIRQLAVIDTNPEDNKFELVLPKDLTDNWVVKPAPNRPVYGFIDLKIADSGEDNEQQIWKPLRGMVEVVYSPTRSL